MTQPFHFGKNWRAYLSGTDIREAAKTSAQFLERFLGRDLHGKTFVDAGCGSGLHSLAALMHGAVQVTSFDYDKDSVSCTEAIREKSSFGDHWKVTQGSLLDEAFMQSLQTFDVVYCWGVAHHTGDMWRALENLLRLAKPEGLVWIAIYNKAEGRFGSSWWRKVKYIYNASPRPIQFIMEWLYIGLHFLLLILHLKNPFTVIRRYESKRGMSWKTDLIDWLGGYPYEYASVAEIFSFFKKHGFTLENIQTTNYKGCNQFLFRASNV